MSKPLIEKPPKIYENRLEGKDFVHWINDWGIYLRSIGEGKEANELMNRWFRLKRVLRKVTNKKRKI